jgi:hypothetical protein
VYGQVNAFVIEKAAHWEVAGGTDDLYQGDGRLVMARMLERWPGVVKVTRKYGRPQHQINWKKFDTPLRLKPGIELESMGANNYGLHYTS